MTVARIPTLKKLVKNYLTTKAAHDATWPEVSEEIKGAYFSAHRALVSRLKASAACAVYYMELELKLDGAASDVANDLAREAFGSVF